MNIKFLFYCLAVFTLFEKKNCFQIIFYGLILLAARTRSDQLVYSQLATEFQRERFGHAIIEVWSGSID